MLPKDIYMVIALKTDDDNTILSMLSVNKRYFNDDEIFRFILQKRYPKLFSKTKEQKEKQTYMKIIHYLNRLKKEFDVCICLRETPCDPEELYNKISNELNLEQNKNTHIYKIINKILLLTHAKYGNLNEVKRIIQNSNSNSNEENTKQEKNIYEAAIYFIRGKGNEKEKLEATKYLVSKMNEKEININNIREHLKELITLSLCAVLSGSLDILKYLYNIYIECGIPYLDIAILNKEFYSRIEYIYKGVYEKSHTMSIEIYDFLNTLK